MDGLIGRLLIWPRQEPKDGFAQTGAFEFEDVTYRVTHGLA